MEKLWTVRAKSPNREHQDRLQGCVDGVSEDGDFRVCGFCHFALCFKYVFHRISIADSK